MHGSTLDREAALMKRQEELVCAIEDKERRIRTNPHELSISDPSAQKCAGNTEPKDSENGIKALLHVIADHGTLCVCACACVSARAFFPGLAVGGGCMRSAPRETSRTHTENKRRHQGRLLKATTRTHAENNACITKDAH